VQWDVTKHLKSTSVGLLAYWPQHRTHSPNTHRVSRWAAVYRLRRGRSIMWVGKEGAAQA
jgi:hypothetical protein